MESQSHYAVAGIDVHKKMLAVVITNVGQPGDWVWERRTFGTLDSDLRALASWLNEHDVQEAVMESTAQYWNPVWRTLEGQCKLHLAHAQSNRGRQGRKRDFADAERLVRRLVAGELVLSFVPDVQQRLWRAATRARHQLTCDRVRLQNQLEALLEDALRGAERMSDLHRQLLRLLLERLELVEQQREILHQTIAHALEEHSAAIARLIEIPGFGVNSAQQIIAEVGPQAVTFDSAAQLAAWAGVCPGRNESAGVSTSDRCPKGNRTLRRVLTEVALAAIKTKGCVFQLLYRRLVVRLGHAKTIWAIAHRLCRLVWKILHQGISYQERSDCPNTLLAKQRTRRLIRQLQALGYQVQLTPLTTNPAC